jgi:hypothetical protein
MISGKSPCGDILSPSCGCSRSQRQQPGLIFAGSWAGLGTFQQTACCRIVGHPPTTPIVTAYASPAKRALLLCSWRGGVLLVRFRQDVNKKPAACSLQVSGVPCRATSRRAGRTTRSAPVLVTRHCRERSLMRGLIRRADRSPARHSLGFPLSLTSARCLSRPTGDGALPGGVAGRYLGNRTVRLSPTCWPMAAASR